MSCTVGVKNPGELLGFVVDWKNKSILQITESGGTELPLSNGSSDGIVL